MIPRHGNSRQPLNWDEVLAVSMQSAALTGCDDIRLKVLFHSGAMAVVVQVDPTVFAYFPENTENIPGNLHCPYFGGQCRADDAQVRCKLGLRN